MPPSRNKKRRDDEFTDEELFGSDADVDADLFADTEMSDAELFGGERRKPPSQEKMGPPAPPRRPGTYRTPEELEPSLVRELGKSALSFAEGASLNTADEVAALGSYLGGKLGLTDEERALEDIAADYNARARKLSEEYPYGHAAGRFATGLATGLAAPGSAIVQGLLAGSQGALSEYADSRDWKQAGIQGGIDTATAGVGAYGANRLARAFGVPKQVAKLREFDDAAAEGALRTTPARPASGPDFGTPQVPTPEAAPRALPSELGAPYDPLAAQTNPTVPEPLRPQPVPRGPAYDPLAAQTRPALEQAPRALPAPPRVPAYDPFPAPTGPAPTAARVAADVADDMRDPVVRTALEMMTPSLKGRTGPAELVDWATQVKAHKLPPAAEKALLRAWTEHVKDTLPSVDPERLMRGEQADLVAYTLGELESVPFPTRSRGIDAPVADDAARYAVGELLESPSLAKPRVRGGTVHTELPPDYALGDFPAPRDVLPQPRVGDVYMNEAAAPSAPAYQHGELLMEPPPSLAPVPQPSMRELKQVALSQARAEMPRSLTSELLRLGKRGAPTATLKSVFKGADLGRRMLTGGVREFASREGGTMVPNAAWQSGVRILDRAASSFVRPDARAQDSEQIAYGDAPTMNYALSATLSSGDTGLPPEEEQLLTEAVVSGDDDAIKRADFRLKQRYPAYARRVERELRALNEQE